MSKDKLQTSFFIGLLAIVLILALFILLPYLTILIFATIFAIIFEPLYRTIHRSIGNASLASVTTIFIVTLIVLTPLFFFGALVVEEATYLYTRVAAGDHGISAIASITSLLNEKIRLINPQLTVDFNDLIKQMLTWVLGKAGVIFSGIAQFILGLFLTMLAFYYLLKDGPRLRDAIIKLSPLEDSYDSLIVGKLRSAIHSVVLGTLTVAVIQGILVSIGFYLFSVPNGALWGAVAAVAALIPFAGTTVVVLPTVISLFITGNTISAVGLLMWGATVVGLIDNLLSPKLIGHGTKIHPLLILFSVLGGLSLFGPAGFLIGPLAISLLFALFEIYQKIFVKSHQEPPSV